MYADWLDENGNPERAEFIRVAVALTLTKLSNAGLKVEEQNGAKWLAGLPSVPDGGHWVFAAALVPGHTRQRILVLRHVRQCSLVAVSVVAWVR